MKKSGLTNTARLGLIITATIATGLSCCVFFLSFYCARRQVRKQEQISLEHGMDRCFQSQAYVTSAPLIDPVLRRARHQSSNSRA